MPQVTAYAVFFTQLIILQQPLYFPNYSIIPAKLSLNTLSLGNLTTSLLCLPLFCILSYMLFISIYLTSRSFIYCFLSSVSEHCHEMWLLCCCRTWWAIHTTGGSEK